MKRKALGVRLGFLSSVTLTIFALASSHSLAAVFDESPTAGAFQAYYGNWGVDADAENPAPNSYNNYRKTNPTACPSLDNCDLALASADEADPNVATWVNMSHPGNPLKSPGMFIGQSPSTTTYEDNVFYLGGIFDIEGGGKYGDSATRTEWDFRVGFLEEPDEFVGVRQPNDESWDLWAGAQHNPEGWATDGVSLQLVTGASDDANQSPIGSTEQFVRANGNGIVLQAGGPPAASLAHEGNREGFPNGVQVNDLTGFSPQGEIADTSSEVETGVAYEDNLEISFWMEDAGDGNVNFVVNLGEVIYQQTFDPGSPDDPKIPNPNTDPNNPFTDGFFDWQNATPVIFVGAIGGTVGATGQMGFTNPNPPGADCDFDDSGACDLADLDELLYTGLGSGDLKYDLDGTGVVDLGDRDAFLRDENVRSLLGDANLDGVNGAADLNAIGTNWLAAADSWARGDFNGDSVTNASDLNDLGIWWTQTADDFANAAAATAAVPEPTGVVMLILGMVGLLATRRRG